MLLLLNKTWHYIDYFDKKQTLKFNNLPTSVLSTFDYILTTIKNQ